MVEQQKDFWAGVVLGLMFLVLLPGGLLVLKLTLHEGLAPISPFMPSVPALLAVRFQEDIAPTGAEIGREGRVADGKFRDG